MQISIFLSVTNVKYTRGTFMFLGAQSFLHRNFFEEVSCLVKYLELLDLVAWLVLLERLTTDISTLLLLMTLHLRLLWRCAQPSWIASGILYFTRINIIMRQKWRLNPIYPWFSLRLKSVILYLINAGTLWILLKDQLFLQCRYLHEDVFKNVQALNPWVMIPKFWFGSIGVEGIKMFQAYYILHCSSCRCWKVPIFMDETSFLKGILVKWQVNRSLLGRAM